MRVTFYRDDSARSSKVQAALDARNIMYTVIKRPMGSMGLPAILIGAEVIRGTTNILLEIKRIAELAGR